MQELKTYTAGIIFAEQYLSELGNKLAEDNQDCDFIAMINMDYGVISYRGIKKDIDLSIIAKYYGGGGHPRASGSPVDSIVKDNLLTAIFNKVIII